MRIVLFFDQLQAGMGGKYDKQIPLGVEKGGIGSYGMFQQYVKDAESQVLATIYCGRDYFFEHEDMCKEKILKLLQKVKADILICGPCFDFKDYTEMSLSLADFIDKQNFCKTLVACSQENMPLIEKYKDHLTIVQMPKKGGVGLNGALKDMIHVSTVLVAQEDTASLSCLY